jgi:hypothetical protein
MQKSYSKVKRINRIRKYELKKMIPKMTSSPEKSLKPAEVVDLKPEDVLKVFKPILPSTLAKELEKAIRNSDEEKIRILMTEVIPILDNYQAKIWNPNFDNEGEQLLWKHEVKKGFIHKETIETWAITNLRAVKIYSASLEIKAIGLAVADAVVMNQYRSSTGSRVGTFIGARGTLFAGVGESTYSSRSQTYGDLVFFLSGREVLRFQVISDPHGVRRMVETLKKQQIRI